MERSIRIGLLTSSMKSPFVDRAVSGMADVLIEEGAELEPLELHGLSPLDYHRFIEDVASRKDLDGLIFCHMHLNTPQILRFKQRGLPLLGLSERIEGLDWATVDEFKAAYIATRYLLDLGHRSVALVSGPTLNLQSRLREDGYLRAMNEYGIKLDKDHAIQLLNFTEEEGMAAGQLLLDEPWSPSAIFVAAGDLAARGLMQSLADAGKRVPEDYSVIGFDGLKFTETLGLTTVDQPLETMGRWAVHRMLDVIKSNNSLPPIGELFEPELIVRKSTGAPVRSAPRALSKTA
jgi:LacI family transcriptional regulator